MADYTPADYSEQKMKKGEGDMALPLKRTRDILQHLGDTKRPDQVLVGFSMETQDLIANSRSKLQRKHADMICANSISSEGTGFGVDTNRVTLITANDIRELPLCSKEETAMHILDAINHL